MLNLPGLQLSERKGRLFAAACCRHIWDLIPKSQAKAIEVAEGVADGRFDGSQLFAAYFSIKTDHTRSAPQCALIDDAHETASWTSSAAAQTVAEAYNQEERLRENYYQSRLLRDILVNPFRPATFNRSWLTPTVMSLAAVIYEERHLPSGRFDNGRLAVLADALEEAGCDDADILGHLRGGGDHVRGCWALDLVLDRK
jgi:hypothetical protein